MKLMFHLIKCLMINIFVKNLLISVDLIKSDCPKLFIHQCTTQIIIETIISTEKCLDLLIGHNKVLTNVYSQCRNKNEKNIENIAFDNVVITLNMVQKMDSSHYYIPLVQEELQFQLQQNDNFIPVNFKLNFDSLHRDVYEILFYTLWLIKV